MILDTATLTKYLGSEDKWVELEEITLSEIIQIQKDKDHICSHLWLLIPKFQVNDGAHMKCKLYQRLMEDSKVGASFDNLVMSGNKCSQGNICGVGCLSPSLLFESSKLVSTVAARVPNVKTHGHKPRKSKHTYSNHMAPLAEMNSIVVWLRDRKERQRQCFSKRKFSETGPKDLLAQQKGTFQESIIKGLQKWKDEVVISGKSRQHHCIEHRGTT